MNAIEARGLTKRYRDKTAVNQLELTVGEKEFFALLGVNGAGKTTLIKMLCCLSAPTAGEASILGHDIRRESEQVKTLVGISPQESAVGGNLSVRENLEMLSGAYGMNRAESRARAQEMIDALHLEQVADKRAKTLSGGWKRRLSIAMALVGRPRVLFLDEPTLGLDVLARRELWQEIGSLKGKVTVVLTTHYLEEAEALADRIGIMAQGRLLAEGTAAELKAKAGTDSFEEAFVRLVEGKCEA